MRIYFLALILVLSTTVSCGKNQPLVYGTVSSSDTTNDAGPKELAFAIDKDVRHEQLEVVFESIPVSDFASKLKVISFFLTTNPSGKPNTPGASTTISLYFWNTGNGTIELVQILKDGSEQNLATCNTLNIDGLRQIAIKRIESAYDSVSWNLRNRPKQ